MTRTFIRRPCSASVRDHRHRRPEPLRLRTTPRQMPGSTLQFPAAAQLVPTRYVLQLPRTRYPPSCRSSRRPTAFHTRSSACPPILPPPPPPPPSPPPTPT